MTPTKEGWYWVQLAPDAEWTLGELWENDDAGWVVTGNTWEYLAKNIHAFGPRIPSPDRLEAMEEVCKASPVHATGWLGDGYLDRPDGVECFHCGAKPKSLDNIGDVEHAPTCPWKRAQEGKP